MTRSAPLFHVLIPRISVSLLPPFLPIPEPKSNEASNEDEDANNDARNGTSTQRLRGAVSASK